MIFLRYEKNGSGPYHDDSYDMTDKMLKRLLCDNHNDDYHFGAREFEDFVRSEHICWCSSVDAFVDWFIDFHSAIMLCEYKVYAVDSDNLSFFRTKDTQAITDRNARDFCADVTDEISEFLLSSEFVYKNIENNNKYKKGRIGYYKQCIREEIEKILDV